MISKPPRGLLHQLFSRPKYRWVQRLTRVRRVHHPRFSFGWAFPIGDWVYFEPQTYREEMVFRSDYGAIKTRPGHWKQCPRETYHDSTTTGRY